MNKLILTLIIGIFLVGTIFAGGLSLSNISLTSKAETTLKAELPINKVATINPTISDITCDKTICRSWISYPNLINTEWIQSKSHEVCIDNITKEDKTTCVKEELSPKEVVEVEIGEEELPLEEPKEICTTETIETNNPICSMVDYTTLELEGIRKSWVESRLENFAGYLEGRK